MILLSFLITNNFNSLKIPDLENFCDDEKNVALLTYNTLTHLGCSPSNI